eukprot:10803647-Alexandrium_andersonii.AAC.1
MLLSRVEGGQKEEREMGMQDMRSCLDKDLVAEQNESEAKQEDFEGEASPLKFKCYHAAGDGGGKLGSGVSEEIANVVHNMPDAAENQLDTGYKAKRDNKHEFGGVKHQFVHTEQELERIKQQSVIGALNGLENPTADRAKREA